MFDPDGVPGTEVWRCRVRRPSSDTGDVTNPEGFLRCHDSNEQIAGPSAVLRSEASGRGRNCDSEERSLTGAAAQLHRSAYGLGTIAEALEA